MDDQVYAFLAGCAQRHCPSYYQAHQTLKVNQRFLANLDEMVCYPRGPRPRRDVPNEFKVNSCEGKSLSMHQRRSLAGDGKQEDSQQLTLVN